MNPSQNNSQVGLRLKSRAVLNFSTPGGMSNAMSRMRVMGTPGGPPGGSQLSQDPSQPLGMPSQPAPPEPISASQMMMSQGMTMFTPDYQTPAEAQFACNMDPNVAPDKENRGQRSPAPLSPQRNKRPRFGYDPTLSQDSQLGSQPMGSQPTQGWNTQPSLSQGLEGLAGRGENSGGAVEGIFRIPEPRKPPGGRAPRAAQSPPCLRNPFLGDEEQPAEVPAHRRSGNSATPAALATMSRLRADFVDLGVVGRGGFCRVFKCISRLDGAMYAVKRTERKLQSEREKQEALREVQAMVGLGGGLGCEHIVRYFGAWMEYDHLYVQLELCDGTLADQFTASMRKAARDRERDERSGGADSQSNASMPDALDDPEDADAFVFGEREILVVMRHVALALSAAHARGVAHLDVKPDNILTLRETYKLADWGRAAPVDGVGNVTHAGPGRASVSVEEGDARYLAPELLRGEFHAGGGVSAVRGGASGAADSPGPSAGSGPGPGPSAMAMDSPGMPRAGFVGLDRADVFSLGATSYELARGAPLPATGEEYQSLRRGRLETLPPGFSPGFRALLERLVREDPAARPTARGVLVELNELEGGAGNGAGAGAGEGGVIGLFSPAFVPDSVPQKTNAEHRAPRGGTPSRLGFQHASR